MKRNSLRILLALCLSLVLSVSVDGGVFAKTRKGGRKASATKVLPLSSAVNGTWSGNGRYAAMIQIGGYDAANGTAVANFDWRLYMADCGRMEGRVDGNTLVLTGRDENNDGDPIILRCQLVGKNRLKVHVVYGDDIDYTEIFTKR